tara:strand:+ start:3746 stop:3997 length:252 start_codon:yes stop_codon:yes gene_type:complete
MTKPTKKTKAMLNLNDRNKFNNEINQLVSTSSMNYIDAILHYCDQNGLEAETVKGLISAENKENLRNDAESLNFFPKTSKLPI